MEAGNHLKMVENLSKNVQALVDFMLQVDEAKRPTIEEILLFPGVIDEVKKLLSSAEFNEEFNLLMMHKLNYSKESATAA